MAVELRGAHCRYQERPPGACARGSFRTIRTGEATLRVICCPKGRWDPRGRVPGALTRGRCKVGTVTQTVLRKPVAGRCPVR